MVPLKSLLFLNLLLLISPSATASTAARILDETPAVPTTTGDPDVNCAPCYQNPPSPPPPPPIYPSPPPPSPPPPDVLPYYSPPPHKKKEPKNCPPPPSPSFTYITGPPGDLYPIDQNYNAAARTLASAAVVGFLLVGLLVV